MYRDKQCILTVNNLIGNIAETFCLFGEKVKKKLWSVVVNYNSLAHVKFDTDYYRSVANV